jgi:peptidoglycan hydrolase-like protein with peptidoglycan-binding domain
MFNMNLHEDIQRIKQMMGISESVSDIQTKLEYGSTDNEVEELQSILNIYKDGKFGPQTERCVQEFQSKMGIEDDGIVGDITKSYLQKLEDGEVFWDSPEYCKSSPKNNDSDIILSPNDTIIDNNSSNGSGVDIILMGGLDYRGGDKSISQQVELLKKTTRNKNVIGFRYNDPSGVKGAIKSHPNAYVVLFSAGCGYSSEIASMIKDKNKLFVVEPYASSQNTGNSVRGAVSSGVPNKNVVTGPMTERGNGVVNGSTSTPQGIGHWGALEYVGNLIK